MVGFISSHSFITETENIDNQDNNIIGIRVINQGKTSVFWYGYEIKSSTNMVLIFASTGFVNYNQDMKLSFIDDTDKGNKVFLTIDRVKLNHC